MHSEVSQSALAEVTSIESLYSEHSSWLVKWLVKKVGCPDNAADISQDTFVRILKCRDVLANLHNPRAYLAKTARNLIIDRARRNTVEKAYLSELSASNKAEEVAASPEQILQALEMLEKICHVLERLPKKVQQTFLLYYFDDYTQSDIAKTLDISPRTVRSYLLQVLVRCQRYM